MLALLRISRLLTLAAALLLGVLVQPVRCATLDEWRAEVARTRMLAENDAPRAYERAGQLHAALPPGAIPADRALALNLLARTEAYMALTDESDQHAQQALELAKQNGDRIGQAEADLNLVLTTINQGRFDEHAVVTTHSLSVLQGVDRPDLLMESMLRTAVMYRRLGQLEESVAMAIQALQIAERSKSPLALAYAHQALGTSFGQSGRQREAEEHHQKMREYAHAVPSKLMEGYALAALGAAIATRGDFRLAEAELREAVGLFRAVGAPYALSDGLYGLAEVLRRQGAHAQALSLLSEVTDVLQRHPNTIRLWFTVNARSDNHEGQGDRAAAWADAQQSYAMAKDLGLSVYRIESAQRLSALAAAAGRHKQAYDFLQEASTLSARAAREKSSTRMVELAERYQKESRQREIDELTRRNELQTVELQKRELWQRWLYTVLGASVLALAGGAFFVIRLRRSEAAIRSLNASLEHRVQASTAELRQQTSYVRTLIDTLPMLAWLKDTQSRYLTVNQATALACGASVEQMTGKLDSDFWPKTLSDAYRADDLEVMRTLERKTVVEALSGVKGEIWIETYKAPVLDEDGTVLGTVGLARDVSERKATEAAREAALAEAERLARQRSEFLAQMSHELRTPLNGILGFAQILQRDKALTERQVRGLKIIQESGHHLLTLITDILDLARIDAAKLELYPSDIDVRAFFAVVADIVRVKAEEKGLLFSMRLAGDLPHTVRADEKRLRQVLLNLLSNAVKFTDRGQVGLTVEVGSRTPSGVVLRAEVRDTGIGMSAAELGRLFQPFEQVGDAERREGGTGLGLAISRELMRLMGGDIHVRSEPGEGSAFSFELALPVVEFQVAEAPRLGLPVGYEGPPRKVLIVDDVAQNRAVLTDSLNVLGFELIEAADGQAALTCAESLRPDLIVMDVSMPVMDGLEATRRLRAMPGLAHVPIIASSGSVSRQVESDCFRAGVNAFVPKPIEQERLFGAIGRLLALQWVYELAPVLTPAPGMDAEPGEWVVPPEAELEALLRLARLGSMRQIREQADHLERLDARHAPLARRLRQLADECQSAAILHLVQALMVHPSEPTAA